MLHNKSQGHRPSGSGEDFKMGFTIYGHGGHLGHVARTIRSLYMQFDFYILIYMF